MSEIWHVVIVCIRSGGVALMWLLSMSTICKNKISRNYDFSCKVIHNLHKSLQMMCCSCPPWQLTMLQCFTASHIANRCTCAMCASKDVFSKRQHAIARVTNQPFTFKRVMAAFVYGSLHAGCLGAVMLFDRYCEAQ